MGKCGWAAVKFQGYARRTPPKLSVPLRTIQEESPRILRTGQAYLRKASARTLPLVDPRLIDRSAGHHCKGPCVFGDLRSDSDISSNRGSPTRRNRSSRQRLQFSSTAPISTAKHFQFEETGVQLPTNGNEIPKNLKMTISVGLTRPHFWS